MRPCTPLTSASTPRESAFKPVPHPAAPVGQSSQTRRHHLTPTPVQQLCTPVQSCGQKRSFLLDRARPVFFSARPKRKWAVYGGKEKMLYPNLHRCASLGNTVLNCSAQIIVFPYVARAQCIQTPNLYPVPTEYQILFCKQDTLFSSFRCRWYTFAENNFVLEPSSA